MIKKILLTLILLINILLCTDCFAKDYNGYIVTLKENDTVSLFSDTDNINENMTPVVPDENIYKIDSDEKLKELTDAGLVEFAEPDYTVTLYDNLFTPNDRYYNLSTSYQYGVNMTKFDSAWNMGIFGNGITVGVIDSGAYPHNELIDNLLPGYNYTVTTSVCKKGAKCTDTSCEHYNTVDTYGHGTFCSGIIGASANDTHIIGASPMVKIVPLKSFVNQSGSVSNIVSAIYDAVDKYNCDVINMSFGLSNTSTNLKNAIKYAVSKSILIVAAAGNDDSSSDYYPGAYEGVVCVGSVDSAGDKSSFSNHGVNLDLSAPGSKIYSCSLSANGLSSGGGTSFAAPYVTSAAAMCKMIKPDITNAEFEALVKSTATPFKEGFTAIMGSGILNVENMLLTLMNDIDTYYSPINRINATTFRIITNLSDSDISFINFWKGNDKLIIDNVSLPANNGYRTDFEDETFCTNYIWEAPMLKPLIKEDFTPETAQ